MADVWNLPEPIRRVPVVLVETIERLIWVDEDDVADLVSRDADFETAATYLRECRDEEPIGGGLTARRARSWELDPREVGPVEACPHCGHTAWEPDESPHYLKHANGCPLLAHYISTRRDYVQGASASIWYAECYPCGWEGPKRPEETGPGKPYLSRAFARQLELDGREHLAGKPHHGSVNKPTGLPDLPAEHSCWRPVPGVDITHLIPAPAMAVTGG